MQQINLGTYLMIFYIGDSMLASQEFPNAFLEIATMTDAQLKSYLEHLKIERDTPSLEYLTRVMAGHLVCVPYDTTDIHTSFRRLPAELSVEHSLARMIKFGRGGLCVQNNILLAAALIKLGFDVYPIAPYSLYKVDDISNLDTLSRHISLIVELEGVSYLVDAGYGGKGILKPTPLPKEGKVECSGQYSEYFELSYTEHKTAPFLLKRRENVGMVNVIQFSSKECTFEMCESVNAVHTSPFSKEGTFFDWMLACAVRIDLEKGTSIRLRLIDDTFYGIKESPVKVSSEAELKSLLWVHFGYKYRQGVGLLFTKELRAAKRAKHEAMEAGLRDNRPKSFLPAFKARTTTAPFQKGEVDEHDFDIQTTPVKRR